MSLLWVNDELVREEDARVSPLDHGFTVADGVFETIKVLDGRPFALDRHMRRLQHSASGLGLGEIDLGLVEKAIFETLAANEPMELGRIRVTMTSGNGPLGSNRGASRHSLTIATAQVHSWPETTSVVVVPWRRNERSPLAGLKTTSYAENVVALEAAHTAGFSEAIFLDTIDRLSEGTGTNVFLVKEEKVWTPSLDCGNLAGITRELVIELCNAALIELIEGEFVLDDLLSAEEVFITSSTRDIHPVTTLAVFDQTFDVASQIDVAVGPVTQGLRKAWDKAYSKNLNP
jgi:branched-chain amino acid aminotransferase